MKKSILFIIPLFLMLFIQGCQKDEIKEGDLVVTEGYIDIKITGRSEGGVLLDESDRYQVYPKGGEDYCSSVASDGDLLTFKIRRYIDITQSEYISLLFTFEGGVAQLQNFSLRYKGKTNDNSLLVFEQNSDNANVNADVEVENYDAQSGTLSGTYSLILSNMGNSNSDNIAIVEGEFYVKVYPVVY